MPVRQNLVKTLADLCAMRLVIATFWHWFWQQSQSTRQNCVDASDKSRRLARHFSTLVGSDAPPALCNAAVIKRPKPADGSGPFDRRAVPDNWRRAVAKRRIAVAPAFFYRCLKSDFGPLGRVNMTVQNGLSAGIQIGNGQKFNFGRLACAVAFVVVIPPPQGQPRVRSCPPRAVKPGSDPLRHGPARVLRRIDHEMRVGQMQREVGIGRIERDAEGQWALDPKLDDLVGNPSRGRGMAPVEQKRQLRAQPT